MTELTKEQVAEFLSTEEGKTLAEEIKAPLLNKRDDLLGQLTAAKEELGTFKSTEETRQSELAEATRDKEAQRLKDGKDFDAYKAFHEEEVAKRDTELGKFKNRYANNEAERLVSVAAAANSKTPAPLKLLLKERVRSTVDESGNVNLTVVDGKGETMYFEGQPANIDHLVQSLKADEQYSPFFAGSGLSGSGTIQSAPVTTGSSKDMNSPDFNLTKTMGNK